MVKKENDTILRTKLYRPPITDDIVIRTSLINRLEKNRNKPLTLVSAPAGYGKSILISSWLEEVTCLNSWLSLDEEHNDLRTFLAYFVAAVNKILPEKLQAIESYLEVPELPTAVMEKDLINELDQIDDDFIVILDDFHLINNEQVLELINYMIKYPPLNMHLCILTRRDPPLSLNELRVYNRIGEFRMADLAFTSEEVKLLFNKLHEIELRDTVSEQLLETTEGWVVGLRLFSLGIKGQEDKERILNEMKGGSPLVTKFLLEQVLKNQPAQIQNYLPKTSILNRFCSELVEALDETEKDEHKMSGREFIKWLRMTNLFIIPLDKENKWFRYHHLFQDLLQTQLQEKYSPEEISALNSRASEYLEGRGYIEEAVEQTFAAGNALATAQIIERNRHAVLDDDRWIKLGMWMNKLPQEIKQERTDLLLSQAWVLLMEEVRLEGIFAIIKRVESLVGKDPQDPALLPEINFFRGIICYFQGEGARSVEFFNKATELLPESAFLLLRSEAEYWTCVALHLAGRKETAIRRLHEGIRSKDFQEGMILSRLIFGLCMIHMLDGECLQAFQEGLRLKGVCRSNRLVFAEPWAMYVQGNASFQMFDLDATRHHFGLVMENRYIANQSAAIDAMSGLAISSQIMGKPDEADETISLAQEYVQWTKDPLNLEIVRSCRARFALLREDLDSAISWQRSFQEMPGSPMMFFFLEAPVITECRVLIAIGSDASLKEATEKLKTLQRLAKAWNNDCQMLEIMVLQALAGHRQGRLEEALETLEQAVAMAKPGRTIRPFVELGQPMADLLKQLSEKNAAVEFVEKLLAAFSLVAPSPSLSRRSAEREGGSPRPLVSPSPSPQPLVEPLTNRELDILELLEKRLQNKEIAEKLFISPETVKVHVRNIFQKLDAGNRREAVIKAKDLGILTQD